MKERKKNEWMDGWEQCNSVLIKNKAKKEIFAYYTKIKTLLTDIC